MKEVVENVKSEVVVELKSDLGLLEFVGGGGLVGNLPFIGPLAS